MTFHSCILCKFSDISLLETINTADLAALYKKRAGVDVERSFPDKQIAYYQCNNCGLKYYWPQVIGDGKFYDDLQQYANYYPKEKAEFLEGAKYITPMDKVLEVGCGQGQFTEYIESQSYVGLEFSEKAIAAAKEKGLTVLNESIEYHAEKHTATYDVVCFFQVLEHVENPRKFLNAALQCLKSGGKLILAVPAEDSFIQHATNFYLNMPPHHASRWTNRTLQKLADLYELNLITCFHEPLHDIHASFYSKTIIYKKLTRLVGLKFTSINTQLLSTMLYGTAAVLSKVTPAPRNKTGQSVMMVYEKR